MTIITRVATLATMALALAGLASTSTPGRAADLTRPAVSPAVLVQPVNNPATLSTVPSVAPTPLPQASADSVATLQSGSAEPQFASLTAAIAGQDIDVATDAVRCLATAVYFESKSEPVAGQLAVAEVILNRSKSGRFPSDVCGVVKQRSQFSFVHGGVLPVVDAGRAQYRTALAVAKVALAAAWNSPARGALYFHNRTDPVFKGIRVAAVGNYIFYR